MSNMEEIKTSDKMCFINLLFKSGCTDSIAISESKEHVWEVLEKKIDDYGKEFRNKTLIFDGIDGHVYLDMSTVAKLEISEKDKGPFVVVHSKLNEGLEL